MLTNKHMKKAELVVEDILSIALSVVVLILLLNLFGGNLQKLVQNSNIGRMLYKNNADTKTAYKKMDTDPTKTQANIQIVADQAQCLTQIHQNAAAGINNYIREVEESGVPLEGQEQMNLALYLTIFAESGQSQNGDPQPNYALNKSFTPIGLTKTYTYREFGILNGNITVLDNPTGDSLTEINVNGRDVIVHWGVSQNRNKKTYNESAKYSDRINSSASERIQKIDGIKKCFQEQYKI